MVSKNQIKLITSLYQKKYRQKHGLFVAEGVKVINEYLQAGFVLEHLFATETDFFGEWGNRAIIITAEELKKISRLTSPNVAVALFKIPEPKPINTAGLVVALDEVNDPGNLGTIIRLCDWFGVTDLVCSENTVDCYNPKVIQATMGSLSRVNINYVTLSCFLKEVKIPVYAAMMDGDTIYQANLPKNGVLVMGNEANGVSAETLQFVKHAVSIPRFGTLQKTESLNVATATAILLSEFKRRE